ncbi:MAG: urease accessory protein [Gammaproteobacteria bacterium]|nr:urease accessory protein [Gammaproteobacteria bacterium]
MSLLLLGFLIGMQHALEADHLAAVAALTTRSRSVAATARQGAAWGLGHTVTLFLFGSIVLWLDRAVPDRLAYALEFAVGVMLVALGVDVLRRLSKQRVHFHSHEHDDGITHFHAHSHVKATDHHNDSHRHDHAKGFALRALFVGLMHGMAGSAALILLTLQTVQSPLVGMMYIGLFGIGSIVGMAVLSATIAIPLRYSANALTWLHNGLHVTIGVVTIVLGLLLMHQVGVVHGLFV